MPWGVRLFGSIALTRHGQVLPLAGEKQRLVVAALALSPGVVVPTDRIIDLVWGDAAPRTARRTVQSHVASLRSLTGREGPLTAAASGYVLGVDRSVVDLLAFEDGVSAVLERVDAHPASTVRMLGELLATWDEPLAGARLSDRMLAVLAPFEELHLQATEALLVAQIDIGEAGRAIRSLESLVRRHPTREHLWLQLARALDATGRRREAINAVQRAREALRDQLGIEPGAALRAQEHRLLEGGELSTGATPASGPTMESVRKLQGRPPTLRSPTIGRATELDELVAALGEHSLLTLTGAGGVGKTRLALELAHRVSHNFADGVTVVELATASMRESVNAALAAGVGAVQAHLDPLDAVIDRVSGAQVLIVLDNCEHVLPAVFDVVEKLRECRAVKILATSREPIGADGERVWRVPPLDPRTVGVELFCQRAKAADSAFSPSEKELEATASICEQLDGMPLAIELAAGCAGSMSLLDLADRLDDRFRLLRRRRSTTDRHQTLLTTVDWSYRLLDGSGQRLFAALSVFAGGFDLAAAEQVGRVATPDSDILVSLTDLVDKSMIEFDPSDGRGRYWILETLRRFGVARLDALPERETVHDRHMEYYAELAEHSHQQFTGEQWDSGKSVVIVEWANLRAAIGRALTTHRIEFAERIVAATYRQSSILVRHEHSRWTVDVLELAEELGSRPNPMVAGAGAWWLHAQGRSEESRALALAGIAAAPTPTDGSTERCWFALCMPERDLDELERILQHWDVASSASSDRFARYTFAWCLAFCSIRSWTQRDDRHQDWSARGVALLEQAVATTNNPGPRIWLAHARGIATLESGDRGQALDDYARAIELSRAAEHHVMEATVAMFVAGALAGRRGPIDAAAYSQAIEITHRHRVYCEITIGYLAVQMHRSGHRARAATLHGFVSASGRAPPGVRWPSLGVDPELVARARAGAVMTLDEAVDFALATLRELSPPASGSPVLDRT
jgi:predicted ATPase/DNA-binding SARP family transcriptional activator